MRSYGTRLLALGTSALLVLSARPTLGQTPAVSVTQVDVVPPPSWLFDDLACAPTIATRPFEGVRVVGSQDTVIKHMLGPGDTLLIGAGSNAGLQPGQRFFVRRYIRTFGATKGPDAEHPISVHTSGWVQILGVDAGISTAAIQHACDGIELDDFLEPFTEPMVAARAVPGSAPQYANMGHILTADEGFQNVASVGQMINIDRGSSAGVVLGQRYLVFRDKRAMRNESQEYSVGFAAGAARVPLVEVGEVMVMAVRPDHSTVEVVMAKDVIGVGDFIAEIK